MYIHMCDVCMYIVIAQVTFILTTTATIIVLIHMHEYTMFTWLNAAATQTFSWGLTYVTNEAPVKLSFNLKSTTN